MFLTIFSGGHVIIVLAVILLLFGGKKIPELMKGLGQGIKEFKDASDLSYCRKCNCSLINKTIHIDHHEIQFVKLVEDFLEINKKTIIIPSDYDKKQITFERIFKEEDSWIGKLFEPYHLQNATLRVLCETCNLTRKKYKKQSIF